MFEIYLIRHAHSEANAGGVSRRERDISLSAAGKRQAAALAARLPESPAVFVSRLRRTRQTAAPYCRLHGVRAQVLPVLDEFSCLPFAAVRGLDGAARRPLAQAYWQRADPHDRAAGESFAAFGARVADFLRTAPQLPPHSLLFGHGIWTAMLAWQLAGGRSDTAADMRGFYLFRQNFAAANAAVWRVRQTAGAWTLAQAEVL